MCLTPNRYLLLASSTVLYFVRLCTSGRRCSGAAAAAVFLATAGRRGALDETKRCVWVGRQSSWQERRAALESGEVQFMV